MGGKKSNPFETVANVATFGTYGAGKKIFNKATGDAFGKSSKIKGFNSDPNTAQFIKDRYKEAILGKGNSVAEKQLAMGQDLANKQALAFAGSTRGTSNPALAFRQAQQMQGEQLADANQKAALLRASEQQAAQEGLANYLTGVENRALKQSAENAAQNEARKNKLFDTFADIGKAAATASDENLKKNAREENNAADKVSSFMDSLKAYNYDYKNKKYGTGKQVGVMAQDLEKTDIGDQMVEDTEDGKMVDYGKGFGAMMASIAELNKRLKKMEGKGA